ncbi:hypothetical protein ACS0TY_022902 [Phlomoides rotata]
MEQYGNQGRNSRSRPTPIPCMKCDMVFFDNCSLLLHYKCHLIDLGHHDEDLASLQSWDPLSLSLSPYFSPYVEKKNETPHTTSPRVNNCFKPSPLLVSFAIPDLAPKDATFLC